MCDFVNVGHFTPNCVCLLIRRKTIRKGLGKLVFKLKIHDVEKFIDIHETTLKAVHNLDKQDRDDAYNRARNVVRDVFDTEGYGEWPQLSDSYLKWKYEEYPGQTILRLEDNYYQAATRKNHPGQVLEYQATSGGASGSDTPKNQYATLVYGIDTDWFASRFGEPYPEYHEHARGGERKYRPVFQKAAESAELLRDIYTMYRNNVIERLGRIHKGNRYLSSPRISKFEKIRRLGSVRTAGYGGDDIVSTEDSYLDDIGF